MMLLANSSGLLPLNETGLTGSTGLRARAVHCQQLIDLAQQTKPLTRALPYERSIWLVQGGGNVTTISAIECTDIALRASETLTVPTHQIMIDRPLGIWWSNR